MGIKDNFSQAVKELWKKDGQDGEMPQAAAGQPSELDRYLREQNSENVNAPVNNTVQNAGMNGSGVPLETPYYPNASQNSEENGNFSRDAQNMQNTMAQNNVQQAAVNNTQPAAAQNSAPESNYNQNVRSTMNRTVEPSGYNNSVGGMNAMGGMNGSADRGGMNTPNNRDNQGMGAGRFVPPPSGNTGGSMPMGSESEETTIISKNTQIEGNIHSLANMTVDGNIRGNLETTRNVDMTGKIVGDIIANNAAMNSAAMQGNVSLKGRMKMDRDTILIGDLSSQYADINGRIRGKLDIVGKAELKRDAIVFGDINASTIAVTDGAIIQGYVNTTFLSKDDSRNVFPDAISIEEQKQTAKSGVGNVQGVAGQPQNPVV